MTAKKMKKTKPTEADAAEAIARAWLGKAGFHEDDATDPDERSPERIEILGAETDDATGEYYALVRVYIPQLDIDHVVDGDHCDGIKVEG